MSEQHRFKLNRCDFDFTDLKKMRSFIIRAFSACLILVCPILFNVDVNGSSLGDEKSYNARQGALFY